MQTRLSTLHEKVLRHDYMKYASYVSSFWAPRRSERETEERRTTEQEEPEGNRMHIRCMSGEETKRRRRRRGEESETEKYQKKEREKERERARQGFVQETAYSGSSPRHHESPEPGNSIQ